MASIRRHPNAKSRWQVRYRDPTGRQRTKNFAKKSEAERWAAIVEADKLRGSFGLSVTWEAPIGPIVISYAFPFNDQPGDRTEDLQFSFGTTF